MTQLLVLCAFFRLAQQDRAVTRLRLAASAGLSPGALRLALQELARSGWVTLEPLALTLPGLAVATAARHLAPRRPSSRRLAA